MPRIIAFIDYRLLHSYAIALSAVLLQNHDLRSTLYAAAVMLYAATTQSDQSYGH